MKVFIKRSSCMRSEWIVDNFSDVVLHDNELFLNGISLIKSSDTNLMEDIFSNINLAFESGKDKDTVFIIDYSNGLVDYSIYCNYEWLRNKLRS